MASSSETRLAYIAESTWGTTPSSPTWATARMTGESLNPNIENVVSDEIRADRNVPDLVQVGSSAGGDVNFELSYSAFDDWLESLLYGAWTTNVLKNGLAESSFTLEKTFETGATDQYHRLTGSIANSLTLTMGVDSIVTGNFNFLSKEMTSAQAEIGSSTYNAAVANPVINAAANFASLTMTGVTSPALMAVNMTITNNLANQRQLGSLASRGIRTGRFEVSGNITAYFENAELFELFLAGTASDLSFKLGGASSKNYVFDLPNIKFETASVVAGANDQALVVEMSYRGLYDSGDAATLKITRTA